MEFRDLRNLKQRYRRMKFFLDLTGSWGSGGRCWPLAGQKMDEWFGEIHSNTK